MKMKHIIILAAGVLLASYVVYRMVFVREKVDAVVVTRGQLVSLIYATGKVSADTIAVLRCESGGTVTHIGAREGASVRRGAVLLNTDKSESVLRIDQAENEIRAADVDVVEKKNEVDRLGSLLASHAIPQKDYDAAKREYDLARISLERRRIMLRLEKENLSKRAIIAPFDGLVYSSSVSLGDHLPPNTECFRMLAPGSLLVEAQVDEQDVANVAVGRQSLVAFDAYPGKKFDAVVTRVVPETDEATKTSRVLLTLTAAQPGLNIGMTATVNIIACKKDGVLILPKTAIIDRKDRRCVFLIVEGRLRETDVTLGITEGNYVEVLSGVGQDMRVVREPKPGYTDNMRVSL